MCSSTHHVHSRRGALKFLSLTSSRYQTLGMTGDLSPQEGQDPRCAAVSILAFRFAIHVTSNNRTVRKLQSRQATFYILYRGADKSLARRGRKQANVSVRMAWISFGALPCKKKKMTGRVSMLLKSRASLTCFWACFLPGRAKGLSTPRYLGNQKVRRRNITYNLQRIHETRGINFHSS